MEKQFSKRRVVRRLSLVANILAALALFLSHQCASISPGKFWFAEVVALSYPFLLILNLLFIIYWLIQFHRYAFISLVIVLSGYRSVALLYQVKFGGNTEDENSLSVMSYNVRLFDLYNWTGNLKTRAKIFNLLKEEKPDIICFQEFYNSDEGDFQNTDALKKVLTVTHAHVEYGITLRKVDHWGLATFSNYPIVGRGRVIYEEGRTNFGIYTDVKIKKDTLRIYNVHLQSNHFKEKDYRFIESPDSGSNEQIFRSSKAILKRIKSGAVKRASQVDELKLHMNNSPYPVILCGDFNDPPFSYAYKVLAEDLGDSFEEAGKGTGATYIGKIPFFRIDYILYDDDITCLDHKVIPSRLSDHHPLKASLVLNRKE